MRDALVIWAFALLAAIALLASGRLVAIETGDREVSCSVVGRG